MSDEQNTNPKRTKRVQIKQEINPAEYNSEEINEQGKSSVKITPQEDNSIKIDLPDESIEIELPEKEIETDPSKLFLEVIASKLIHEKWAGKPHEAFKSLPNSSKGDAGEEFVKRYTTVLGFTAVKLKRHGDWDLIIENKKFEVKLASEDVSGSLQFNHIRYDSKYDFIICLGVTPTQLIFGVWSKGDLVTGKAGNLVSMGKNQNASFKLTKKVSSLQDIRELKDVLNAMLK